MSPFPCFVYYLTPFSRASSGDSQYFVHPHDNFARIYIDISMQQYYKPSFDVRPGQRSSAFLVTPLCHVFLSPSLVWQPGAILPKIWRKNGSVPDSIDGKPKRFLVRIIRCMMHHVLVLHRDLGSSLAIISFSHFVDSNSQRLVATFSSPPQSQSALRVLDHRALLHEMWMNLWACLRVVFWLSSACSCLAWQL